MRIIENLTKESFENNAKNHDGFSSLANYYINNDKNKFDGKNEKERIYQCKVFLYSKILNLYKDDMYHPIYFKYHNKVEVRYLISTLKLYVNTFYYSVML